MIAESNLTVNLIGGGLVVLGIALLVATLAFWRSAVEDPEVLAPLEVMADRRFVRAGHEQRAALLDSVRPSNDESGETLREVRQESHREAVRRARRARAEEERRVHEDFAMPESGPEPHDPIVEDAPFEPVHGDPMIDPLLKFQNSRPQD